MHLVEGLARLQAVLAIPGAEAPSVYRARCLYSAGHIARQADDLNLSRSYGEEALALARRLRDDRTAFNALWHLGRTALYTGDWNAAETLHGQAVTVGK